MNPMQIFGMVLVSAFWVVVFVTFLVAVFTSDKNLKSESISGTALALIPSVIGTIALAASFHGK